MGIFGKQQKGTRSIQCPSLNNILSPADTFFRSFVRFFRHRCPLRTRSLSNSQWRKFAGSRSNRSDRGGDGPTGLRIRHHNIETTTTNPYHDHLTTTTDSGRGGKFSSPSRHHGSLSLLSTTFGSDQNSNLSQPMDVAVGDSSGGDIFPIVLDSLVL